MTITDAGMEALRAAATLADVLPRARIQLRHGDRCLLTVSRTPLDDDPPGWVVPPCGFRSAVTQAWRLHQQGSRFRFLDLPPGTEPAIHVGLPAGDAVLPGHIYRLRASGDRHLFLFTTGLDPAGCEAAIAATLTTTKHERPDGNLDGFDPAAQRVGFHRDAMTGITVVHALDADASLISRLLEICAATEVIAQLESTPPPSRDDVRP